MRVLLSEPRGVCAGVRRAVAMVERALELHGPPIYVRREIVHNRHTVDRLRAAGAIFVQELSEVPSGARVIFSAHGVSPAVKRQAEAGKLIALDATCPLVGKVHGEVLRFGRQGHHLILIGHEGHDEVVGTLGHAPDQITLVTDVDHARRVELPVDENVPLMVLTQTTLSVDDTAAILRELRRRFPRLSTPNKDDICYATQNRQDAVKSLCDAGVDLILVVGSKNSSNSKRLVDTARDRGVRAELIDGPEDIERQWIEGARSVGLTAGASSPESQVQRVTERLRTLGASTVETHLALKEDVFFALPRELR